MGDDAAGVSRRRMLKGIGATAALTWSAPKLSSLPAGASLGTPPPTTEPPSTTPSTTQPPARAVTGTASGTTRKVPPEGDLYYQATGTFTLRVLRHGTYTVNSHWTPLDGGNTPPFHLAVEGTFRLEPSSGGALYGYMRGTEVLDANGHFTATWNLDVQGGEGAYSGFPGATGSLRWQGTRAGDLLQSTDEFTVNGSLRLP